MDENRNINVLYSFDNKFWRIALVSMASALNTKYPDTNITIYCMVAPHTHGRRKIDKFVRKHGGRLVWRVINKDENPFVNFAFLRWSPVIFYRLFACNIFPDVEKMLYLDSDTLVMRDLCELFNTDISNYAVGAVRDIAPTNDPLNPSGAYVAHFKEDYLKHDLYVNSGVLLLNLPKMQTMLDKLLAVSVPLRYPDQDVINVALDGAIKSLELKYNFVPNTKISRKFDEAEVVAAQTTPVILHYYATKPYIKDAQYVPVDLYNLYNDIAHSVGFSCEFFAGLENRRKTKDVIKQFVLACRYRVYKIYAILRMIVIVGGRVLFPKHNKQQ